MKILSLSVLVLVSLPAVAQMAMDHPVKPDPAASERLGTVSFSISCAASVQRPFNRGVAQLHDFGYDEALQQFQEIVKSNPDCAMTHWGIALSYFHQIWNRPSESDMANGWAAIQQAQSAQTPRERAYVAALTDFYRPGKQQFPERVQAYSDAMGKLYTQYPDDVDAGAFYAL
jgi:hypothetical protein